MNRYASLMAVIAVILAPSPALAERIPAHLAGMAAGLYKSARAELEKADPGDPHGWAEIRAHQALRDNDIHRWAPQPPPQWTGLPAVAELLELDLGKTDHREALVSFLRQAQSDGTETALLALLEALDRSPPEEEALADLVSKLDELLTAGFGDLARSHVIDSDEGPDITFDWQPERGEFRVKVEQPGSDFVAPYSSSLVATLQPVLPEDAGEAVTYDLAPAEVPVRVLDSQDLRQLRVSIFGEWVDQEGARWVIAPLGEVPEVAEEAPEPNPRAALLDRLAAAEAELAELRGSKVFVWENPETGEREEQTRFRRKKDPWEYRGEQSAGEGGAERIAELEAEIADINSELAAGPKVPPAPALPEPTDDGSVIAIQLSYTRDDGTVAMMDEARLAGDKITGNRILNRMNDISDLPETVISQLVNEWHPPEWVEFTISAAGNGDLQVSGSRHRLHVTYGADDHRVSSIHTPYSRPRILARDDRRKAP